MKKTLLTLLLFSSLTAFSQTNFNINWTTGVNGAAASLTISPGDTVTWTLTNNFNHTVSSLAGATESFDSGTISGAGTTYFHKFILVGSNDYQCNFHTATMFGTITVDSTLSMEGKFLENLNIYPNPVMDVVTITSLIEISGYEVHDVLGNRVIARNESGNVISADLSTLTKGVYFVKVSSGNFEKTFRIVRK